MNGLVPWRRERSDPWARGSRSSPGIRVVWAQVAKAAPVPRKGRLHTYRLPEGGSDNGKEVKLDLGFRVRLALQGKATLGIEPGRVVECVADSKGQLEYAGRRYSPSKTTNREQSSTPTAHRC